MNRDRKTTGLIVLTLGLALLWATPASAAITAPIISGTAVTPLTPTSARLEATINPGERPVKPYFFEYVSQAGFEEDGYQSASRTPEATIANGKLGVPVSAQVTGLAPHTTYHFRAYAKNSKGESFGPDTLFTTFSSPQPFGPCPNDALRAGQPSAALPDCRAYEQASPVDKNGGDVTGMVSFTKTSPNGNRVSFLATSPIPGAEGAAEFFPPYLATRGAGGWSTQGLFPPQREGQYAFVDSWTPDFATTYSWARRVVEQTGNTEPFETALLARSSDGGPLQTIVPHTRGFSTPTVPGTSEDGSVVFFEFIGRPGPLTPDAPKERPNLYVWDRDTGVYQLAGVMNDGKAPPAGSFAGSYAWLTGNLNDGGATGASRAKYDTRDQHAIAPDGSSVYFTAAKTGQLYLRLNPTAEQSPVINEGEPDEECTDPELACTIHVSASQKTNGEGPDGTDSAGPAPAAFLGATPDGSQAYFMSSEKLTNDANTGPEQPPAQIGRAKIGEDEAEEVQPGFLPRHALGLATSSDGHYLYWVDPTKGTIARADLEAPEPEKTIEDEFIVPGPVEYEVEPGVTESVPSTPRYVAVGPCAEGGECVYWTNTGRIAPETGFPEGQAGTIGRARLDSNGLPETNDPAFIRGASNPQGVEVNTENVYWANSPKTNGKKTIGRAAIDGAPAFVNQSFVELEPGSHPQGLALSPNYIYYSFEEPDNENGYVGRVQIEGGSPEYVGIGKVTVGGIAVDSTGLYWVEASRGSIGRIPLSAFPSIGSCETAAECEMEFVKPGGTLVGLATGGDRLYWSANGEAATNPGKDLYRFDSASGSLTDLTPDPSGNGAEVQGILGSSDDGSFLYFVANGAFGSASSAGSCRLLSSGNYSGTCNLYVDHDGQVASIARIDAGAADDPENWWPLTNDAGQLAVRTSRVSPDGRTLLFRSTEKLTSYENAGVPEFYRYTYGNPGSILCVTCNPTGVQPLADVEGEPNLGNIVLGEGFGTDGAASALSRNLSADGNRVFFNTPESLVPADTNGREGCPTKSGVPTCQDVYEWEAKGSGSCESEAQNGGCLYLLSSGNSSDASIFADASVNGDSAFIFTRSRLAPQDQDSLQDVYGVRVEGGLPSQNQPPPPVPCEGEACKGAAAASPTLTSPATTNVSESGNQKPGPVKCGKGKRKVKRHGRTVCVKNTKKPKKHNKTNKHGRTH
ncbi:MAG TPA: fibronectin type III domain-containing protein [Solirubrobacterales bacterium]|nr:fibronectin type III domain-containing protein [Solirubrobacterales bacterium]